MSSAMASSMAKNSSPFKVVLGSSSPARREILADMGYEFTVMCADIDERAIRREKPEELVKALAEAKAEAIKLKLHGEDSAQERDQPTILITSDQVMVSKGMIRERPKGQEEAREFIKGYSGDKAFAVNYVLVTNLSNGASKGGWDIPEIYFHHIPEDFIQSVVKEGHMTCVAGGLKLTHPSVLPFIKQSAQWIAFEDSRGSSLRGLFKKFLEPNDLHLECHLQLARRALLNGPYDALVL
nr:maf-like protein DDB_G0281937 isoform X2 [Oryza sativa Japonica Group]